MEGAWKDYDRGGVLKYIKIDEKIFKDSWGAFWRISDDEEFVGWLSGPLVNAKDPDEIDEIYIPGINDIVDDPNLPKNVQELKEKGIFVRGTITQVYKQAWMLRGMENVLMDFLINKPFIEKLYDKIYRLDGEILRRMTKSGMDMVGFDGDIAMQHSLMMGENIWRAFDKPRLAEVVALCKKTNPDVHIYMHSDGDISKVIPDLIEIGFDVIDPIQPESMDPIKQKKLFGDKITLHGCGSLQKTLPFGTPEDCRKEAIYYIEQCGQNGGLVLGASNTINYDVPVQNIVAWYEAVRDYIFK
jgi:uroporphyrinogen decarboxylase